MINALVLSATFRDLACHVSRSLSCWCSHPAVHYHVVCSFSGYCHGEWKLRVQITAYGATAHLGKRRHHQLHTCSERSFNTCTCTAQIISSAGRSTDIGRVRRKGCYTSPTPTIWSRLRRRIQARVATMSHNYAIEITGR